MSASPTLPMRSWLFAPGDSEKKMGKAAASTADIALFDLEDSVAPENKAAARAMVAEQIAASTGRARLWVRINPVSTAACIADLAAIIPSQPGGVFLPKAEGAADISRLHHYLTALEAANGIPQGRTLIAALVTETAAAMFRTGEYAGDYPGRERLAAMSWGAEDLSAVLGASEQRGADGEYAHTYEMARSLCLIGASAAGIAAIETVQPEFRDLEALEKRARNVRAAGFRGMLAIHPAQVDPINAAFTPSAQELAHARAIVQAFADHPGAGVVALDGAMLDRPHLALAQRLLAEAKEK
ncbi:HpcH/HpaI aldolase/citrate lyase family protein [Erythrobacter sanguineus]|uniref:Citrate lyase subunit beta / citryl-CoA lyase n=1 Tax=Erythrobacter sanguineus TaxID=198312 RepID=A0A1M7SHR8_9SPHN|nr:CoA ester lyase [Erythrobacter sanguineus]SHN57922.1 citrate lyase subunit beta / citryl-CoA lyase [Erythrobacter sanguineus]